MKKKKGVALLLSALACSAVAAAGFSSCGQKMEEEIRLTVWVSEADQAFAKEVAEKF